MGTAHRPRDQILEVVTATVSPLVAALAFERPFSRSRARHARQHNPGPRLRLGREKRDRAATGRCRARELGAIMETIADLADEVDRERAQIPRSVGSTRRSRCSNTATGSVLARLRGRRVCRRKRRAFWDMHDRLLTHQDALAPRGPGRLTPRSSHSMRISLSEGLRGRRFAARVAEDVPSPRRERRHGQPTSSSTAAVTQVPRPEDAEPPLKVAAYARVSPG